MTDSVQQGTDNPIGGLDSAVDPSSTANASTINGGSDKAIGAEAAEKHGNGSTGAAGAAAGAGAEDATGKEGKKGQRRQHPQPTTPLPATIEETRKKIQEISAKGLQKPDNTEREAQSDKIQKKIDALKRERSELEDKMNAIRNQGSGLRDERAAARAKQENIRAQQKQLKQEKDALIEKEKAARESLAALKAQEKKLRDQIKFKSEDEVQKEIQRLERQQSTESLSLKEEKAILARIKELRSSLTRVDELKAYKANVAKAQEKKNEISDLVQKKTQELRAVSKQFDDVRDELAKIDEKSKAEGNNFPQLKERKERINEEIDGLFKKIKEVHAHFRAKNDDYYQQIREKKHLQDHMKRLEDEEYKRQQEEIRQAREQEELSRKPWTEEIAICDHLLGHLRKLVGGEASKNGSAGKEAEDGSDAEGAQQAGSDRLAIPKGMKAVRKHANDDEDDDDVYSKMAKKNSRKGKKKRGPPGVGNMTFSVDVIESFDRFGMLPPDQLSQVPPIIEDLKKKREILDSLPRGEAPNWLKYPSSATTGPSAASSFGQQRDTRVNASTGAGAGAGAGSGADGDFTSPSTISSRNTSQQGTSTDVSVDTDAATGAATGAAAGAGAGAGTGGATGPQPGDQQTGTSQSKNGQLPSKPDKRNGKTGGQRKGGQSQAMPSMDNDELFPSLPGQRSPKMKQTASYSQGGPSAVDLVKANGSSAPLDSTGDDDGEEVVQAEEEEKPEEVVGGESIEEGEIGA